MNQSEVFVALSTFAERDRRPMDALVESRFRYKIHNSGKRITTEELLIEGREAAVVIAGVEPYDQATMEKLPNLRCICRCGVGVDSVDLEAARARGIAVFNTPDSPTAAVAELTLSMMLSLCRNFPRNLWSMSEKKWVRHEAHLLAGRRVGLIGFGKISRRVAELVRAFGADVAAFDPVVSASAMSAAGVRRAESIEAILEQSDVISLNASKSARYPLRISSREIGKMRAGTILINVARGDMLEEQPLLDALRSGHLSGAGLDVFPNEPYSGQLCELQNVILTPHCATLTVETRAAMELECVDKAVRFLRGEIAQSERVV